MAYDLLEPETQTGYDVIEPESKGYDVIEPIDTPSLRPVLSESELGSTTPPRNLAFDVQTAVQEPRLESTGMGVLPEHGLLTAAGIGPEHMPDAVELQEATRMGAANKSPISLGVALPLTAVAKTVTGIADWGTSIEGFPQLVAAMIPGLDLVMAGKFAADMVEGGIVSAEDLGKAAANKDWQGVADSSANFIASAYGTKAVTGHAIKTGKARWDRFSERVVPGSVEMPVIGIEKEAQQRRDLIAQTAVPRLKDDLGQPVPFTERTAAAVTEAEVKPETPKKEDALPDWAREAMIRDGLDPNRPFNDVDLKNPSVRSAIESDPTLTPEQKVQLLKTGSLKKAEPPKVAEVVATEKEMVGMGGATMEEVAPSPTSLKNETGVLERHLHGLPEAYPGETQKMLPAMLRARDTLSKDPLAGSRLAEDLKQNPERGLTGDESALLLQHKDALLKAKNDAASKTLSKDPTIKAEGELAFENASNQLLDLLDALKFRGTQAGRELRWRQALLFEDFSFESMRSDKRASVGRELSERENAEIKSLHDKIAELEKQLSEKETASTTTERTTAIEESVAEAKTSFKATATERDLAGERSDVIDHLKERAQENGDLIGSNASIQKLMELLAREGVTERTAMENAVHGILKEIMPDMTLLETQDLMSGYGKYKPLSKDPIKTIVRGIKGEIQQVRKLLDFFSGKAPAKTGVERRIPTQIEHAFIKVVNEAKKAFGTIPTDPAAALKSALDAINTRLKNRLTDLKQEVATRQKIVREKTPSPYNEETLRLRKEIEEVQKQHDEIFGKPELTDAQRLSLAEKSADRQIAELEEQLRTGRIFSEGKKPSVLTSDRLEAARAKIEALKEERAAARETIQPTAEPEARMLQQILTRYRNLEASYKDRLARGDFSKRVRKEQPVSDAILDARARVEQAKNEFHKGLQADKLARQTRLQKIWRSIRQTKDAFVNITSSYDLSAPRQAFFALLANSNRVLTSPRAGAKLLAEPFVRMIQALKSEVMSARLEQRLKDRHNAKNGVDKMAKVEFTDIHAEKFTRYEENARSILDEWAQLPWKTGNAVKSTVTAPVKVLAKGVRMSNRAFITFLNTAKAGLLDHLLEVNFRDRPPTEVELLVIGNAINVATGRGKLNPALAKAASEVMWSPKLFFSRLQALTLQPLWGGGPLAGSGRARKIVAKEYARVIISGTALYGISRYFDDDNQEKLTSSDFGKIERDNTRIDLWEGFQQPVVLGARLATGESTSIAGKTRDIDTFGTGEVIWNFFKNKARPDIVAAVKASIAVVDLGKGDKDVRVTPGEAVKGMVPVPLAVREVIEVMQEQGMTEGTIIQILSTFGAGVSNYEGRESQK